MVDFTEVVQYIGLIAIVYCSDIRYHLDESTLFGVYFIDFELINRRKTIHLASFFFGMLTCIFLYFAIYLPYYKQIEEEWEDYCPVRV